MQHKLTAGPSWEPADTFEMMYRKYACRNTSYIFNQCV